MEIKNAAFFSKLNKNAICNLKLVYIKSGLKVHWNIKHLEYNQRKNMFYFMIYALFIVVIELFEWAGEFNVTSFIPVYPNNTHYDSYASLCVLFLQLGSFVICMKVPQLVNYLGVAAWVLVLVKFTCQAFLEQYNYTQFLMIQLQIQIMGALIFYFINMVQWFTELLVYVCCYAVFTFILGSYTIKTSEVFCQGLGEVESETVQECILFTGAGSAVPAHLKQVFCFTILLLVTRRALELKNLILCMMDYNIKSKDQQLINAMESVNEMVILMSKQETSIYYSNKAANKFFAKSMQKRSNRNDVDSERQINQNDDNEFVYLPDSFMEKPLFIPLDRGSSSSNQSQSNDSNQRQNYALQLKQVISQSEYDCPYQIKKGSRTKDQLYKISEQELNFNDVDCVLISIKEDQVDNEDKSKKRQLLSVLKDTVEQTRVRQPLRVICKLIDNKLERLDRSFGGIELTNEIKNQIELAIFSYCDLVDACNVVSSSCGPVKSGFNVKKRIREIIQLVRQSQMSTTTDNVQFETEIKNLASGEILSDYDRFSQILYSFMSFIVQKIKIGKIWIMAEFDKPSEQLRVRIRNCDEENAQYKFVDLQFQKQKELKISIYKQVMVNINGKIVQEKSTGQETLGFDIPAQFVQEYETETVQNDRVHFNAGAVLERRKTFDRSRISDGSQIQLIRNSSVSPRGNNNANMLPSGSPSYLTSKDSRMNFNTSLTKMQPTSDFSAEHAKSMQLVSKNRSIENEDRSQESDMSPENRRYADVQNHVQVFHRDFNHRKTGQQQKTLNIADMIEMHEQSAAMSAIVPAAVNRLKRRGRPQRHEEVKAADIHVEMLDSNQSPKFNNTLKQVTKENMPSQKCETIESLDSLKQNIKILVVDDQEFNLLWYQELLKNINKGEVHYCQDAYKAIAKVEATLNNLKQGKPEQLYDLILMDFEMPGSMHGDKATIQILSMYNLHKIDKDKYPRIHCITANDNEEFKAAAKEAGMIKYMNKPITKQQLIGLMKEVHK